MRIVLYLMNRFVIYGKLPGLNDYTKTNRGNKYLANKLKQETQNNINNDNSEEDENEHNNSQSYEDEENYINDPEDEDGDNEGDYSANLDEGGEY